MSFKNLKESSIPAFQAIASAKKSWRGFLGGETFLSVLRQPIPTSTIAGWQFDFPLFQNRHGPECSHRTETARSETGTKTVNVLQTPFVSKLKNYSRRPSS
jgi:hypothetical protein